VQARFKPVFFRQLTSGQGTLETFEDFDEERFLSLKLKKPKRRWMSVTDLVTEVETSMVQGIHMNKGGEVYANLVTEAERVRTDNDTLMEEIIELKSSRANYVALEDELTNKLHKAGTFSAHEGEIVEATKKIKEIDLNLASLQIQKQQNIKDVGHLKRTLSRIEKRSDVRSIVAKVEEALTSGRVLSEDGAEAASIRELLGKLNGEFDRVEPKIVSYEEEMVDIDTSLQELTPRITSGETSAEKYRMRWELMDHLKRSMRMLSQVSRLRDIQIMNAQEINQLERALSKLQRSAKIHGIISSGDREQMKAKVDVLREDIGSLRRQMKDIESKLDPHHQESLEILAILRRDRNTFSARSGKQRELLIANLHKEEQWKKRLAVLRFEKMQNFRFIALLEATLAAKS
jgi:hypothetical protein